MIGTTLAHYTLAEVLGTGGMGTVYRARDSKLDRDVALKLLPPEMAADPERRARFLREAKAVAALQHPNIVTLHSVEEEGEHLFLTMELVEGSTFDAVLPTTGVRLPKLLESAIPLVDAVAYAHSKGITHRDLKPSNVMLDDRGRVRILDFGLVKLLEPPTGDDFATLTVDQQATAEGKILGTAAYMSPEQAEGKAIDHRTDIFSLGVVLYEMATGQRPFQGDTHVSTISSVLKDEPRPVSEINASLPRHLGRIIHKCLAKDPEQRYQTATDLRIDLEGLKQETASGITEGPIRPSHRAGWKIPGIASAVVLGALALWNLFGGGGDDPAPAETARPAATAESGRTMLVVLPFQNLGPPEDAYFAQGVTEEITSRLASVEGFGVISRTSAAKYADTDKSLPEIGRELGVAYVVEGSVRWQKDADGLGRVRVTPQLVRVADDTQLWSDRYDERMEAIFDVQTRIAEGVVGKLGEALGVVGLAAAETAAPTKNFEAYQAYLQGLDASDRFTGTEDETAIDLFQRAVDLDPDFADAWFQLSKHHSSRAHVFHDTSEERLGQARAAADRTMALDPALGHFALGYYYYWGRKEYQLALEEFEKTGLLETDPEVMTATAYVIRRQGDVEGAIELQTRALELDPRNHAFWGELAHSYWNLNRLDEADRALTRAVAEQNDSFGYLLLRAFCRLEATGDVAVFREAIDSAAQDHPMMPMARAYLAMMERDWEQALDSIAEIPIPVFQGDDMYLPLSLMDLQVRGWMGDREGVAARKEAVLTELEAAVAEAPKDWRRRIALANGLVVVNRPEDAIREARTATDLLPVSRDALNGRVALYQRAVVLVQAGAVAEGAAILRELMADPIGSVTPNGLRMELGLRPHLDHPEIRDLVSPTP